MGPGLGGTAAKKAFKNASQVFRCNATAAVPDLQLNVVLGQPLTDLDGACESELERVGYQVEYDLFPLVPIHIHRFRKRGTVDRQRDAGALESRTKHAGEIARERSQINRFIGSFDATSFDARELEE